jgi:thiol-disulfide isomerase/thioredoxin
MSTRRHGLDLRVAVVVVAVLQLSAICGAAADEDLMDNADATGRDKTSASERISGILQQLSALQHQNFKAVATVYRTFTTVQSKPVNEREGFWKYRVTQGHNMGKYSGFADWGKYGGKARVVYAYDGDFLGIYACRDPAITIRDYESALDGGTCTIHGYDDSWGYRIITKPEFGGWLFGRGVFDREDLLETFKAHRETLNLVQELDRKGKLIWRLEATLPGGDYVMDFDSDMRLLRMTIRKEEQSDEHVNKSIITSEVSGITYTRIDGLWFPVSGRLECSVCWYDGTITTSVFDYTLDDVQFMPLLPAQAFKIHLPEGCQVFDRHGNTSYIVGVDLPGTIATAKKKDQFYMRLLGQTAPPLQGRCWFGTDPLDLAKLKGRRVILHFWSIDCLPCVRKVPSLQREFGKVFDDPNRPAFISVHAGGGDSAEMLQRIRDFIQNKGITFPVMVDSPDAEDAWGKTCRTYGVYALPTDAVVDNEGKLLSIGTYKHPDL